MRDRLDKLRKKLGESGYDGFISLDAATNLYLSGFHGSTSAVIVTVEEALLLCDFRYMEQAQQEAREIEIEEAKGDLAAYAAERLMRLGLRKVVYDSDHMLVSTHDKINACSEGVLVADGEPLAALRRVKDRGELDQIRAAMRLSEEVLSDVLGALKAGVLDREIAALFDYGFRLHGAEGPSFETIVLFGPRTSLPHGRPCGRTLTEGDSVLLDFGCRMNGYCSDLTRTYAFGRIPGAWFEEIYDLVLTAQQLSLEAARPGIRCFELDAVARDLIRDAGYASYFGHGLGHGLGIEVHEGPRLNPRTDIVLEPGMVLTVEPGVYLPGKGGVRIEDVIVITEDGSEQLSSAPKAFRVLHP